MIDLPNHATGADGVKIAVLRKGRACFDFIWAAAQWRRSQKESKGVIFWIQ